MPAKLLDLCRSSTKCAQDDIWQSIKDALEAHTGQNLPDYVLSKYFVQQLLAPGNLCQQALSQALQELHQTPASPHASVLDIEQQLNAAAQVNSLEASAPASNITHICVISVILHHCCL